MNRGFATELRRVVIFTILGVLLGLKLGQLTLTLLFCGAVYMAFVLWQIHRLDVWLHNSTNIDPPDASGIWGEIFDNMSRLQTKQAREKRRLQSVIRRTQDITASIKDGVLLINAGGEIEWSNLAARQLLRIRKSDQGFPLVNFLRHPEFIRYFEREDYSKPVDLPAPYSDDIHLQLHVTPYGKKEKLLVIRDITQVYHLEQMRKDFIGNASHELRTPLTVLRGYLETFSDSQDLPQPWHKPIDKMRAQAMRMDNLVTDLILLSKLETAATQEQEKVELKPLLARVRSDALAVCHDERDIEVTCDLSLSILGNEKELYSAISNLVMNATKYSIAGGKIFIVAEKGAEGLSVSIEDQGPGIDPIHLPRLTERFYRVDHSRYAETGGTGLGLAIVKHVLLRHNAELDINSQVGTGSQFSCLFPIQRVVE